MSIVAALAIVLVAVGVAIGAMLFVRRNAPEGSYFTDGDRASGIFGVLATGFSIFAGFVIFLAFTSYDESRSGAEVEALNVVQQVETAQFFPAAYRARLTGELVCYGRYVAYREWRQMEAGANLDTLNPWGAQLFRTLKRVTPVSATQQSAYDKWLDQTSEREAARQDRIHGAAGIIPTSIWIVLLLIAGIVFAFMLFFADSAERATSQAMLIGSATLVVVVTLLAINALDNPYRAGPGTLEPVAMERSLRLIDEALAVLDDRTRVPCDATGKPS